MRLGDDVVVDLSAYEVRRGDVALKLERIPMEVLLLLVQHPGRLVTREQIVEKIWGREVFLDTDNSINGAMRKIRQALKDDPEDPRFILTVKGKGYRFIAPVSEVDCAPTAMVPEIGPPAGAPPDPVPVRPSRKWVAYGLGAAAIIAAAVGIVSRWNTRGLNTPSRVMLAVLPFENLTGDAGQDYVTDGVTEEMITQLGRLDPGRVGVIARNSVMQYRHTVPPLDRIARDLHVQYVLEGSVRRGVDHVRVTAQLIRVQDGSQVWAREYDRDMKDLLGVQDEIAQEVADEIELTLTPLHKNTGAPRLSSVTATSYDVDDLYLKGRYFWNQRTRSGFTQAIRYFEAAKAKDPSYTPAYAGLADAYVLMSTYGVAPSEEYMPKARAAAVTALQLDESNAEAHAVLALIAQNYDWDWQTAEKEFRRAIQVNPNSATAHQWYAESLAFQGRFDEALSESEQARLLDPLSLIIAADNGAILYFSRQYDRAIERLNGVLAMDPSSGRAQVIIGAYVQNGQLQEALAQANRWSEHESGPWIWSTYASLYGRLGDLQKANEYLEKLRATPHEYKKDNAPMLLSAYLGMGDKEKALGALQDAFERRDSVLTALKVDPEFDALRDDPRFQKILARVGLAHVPETPRQTVATRSFAIAKP